MKHRESRSNIRCQWDRGWILRTSPNTSRWQGNSSCRKLSKWASICSPFKTSLITRVFAKTIWTSSWTTSTIQISNVLWRSTLSLSNRCRCHRCQANSLSLWWCKDQVWLSQSRSTLISRTRASPKWCKVCSKNCQVNSRTRPRILDTTTSTPVHPVNDLKNL